MTRSPTGPKPPSAITEAANNGAQISFDDPGDFGRAQHGLVAQIADGRVMLGDHKVWDVANHGFVADSDQNPSSVHPGLWLSLIHI